MSLIFNLYAVNKHIDEKMYPFFATHPLKGFDDICCYRIKQAKTSSISLLQMNLMRFAYRCF